MTAFRVVARQLLDCTILIWTFESVLLNLVPYASFHSTMSMRSVARQVGPMTSRSVTRQQNGLGDKTQRTPSQNLWIVSQV